MIFKAPAPSSFVPLYIAFIGLAILAGAFTIRAFPIVLGVGTLIGLVAQRHVLWLRIRAGGWAIASCLALVGLCLISTLWSVAPDETCKRALKLIPLMLLGMGFWIIAPRVRDVLGHPGLVAWPVALMGGGLFIFAETVTDLPVYRWANGLAVGDPRVHPNVYNKELGMLIFSAVPIAALMIRARRGMWMMAPLCLLGLCVFTMTNQSLQVAVPIMGLAALIAFFISPRLLAGGMGVVALCGLAVAPFLAPWLFTTFVTQLGGDWLREASAAMRLEIWDFVSRAVMDRPWLGHGMEAARFMVFDSERLYFPTATIMHPHNGALQIWLEFGAVGVGVFGMLWAIALYAIRAQRIMLVLVAGLSVAFFLTWGLWQSWWLACVFFTLGLAHLYEAAAREPDVAPRSDSSAASQA